MQLADLAKMVAIDGKRDGQRERPGPAHERPPEELPVVDPLLADDAQSVDGTKERQHLPEEIREGKLCARRRDLARRATPAPCARGSGA